MRVERISGGVALAFVACATMLAAQQSTTSSTVTTTNSATAPRKGGNPEAAKIVNPVVAAAESTAAGRRAYTQFCANCHGTSGKGDGRGAPAGAQMPDLTDAKWDYGSTDGEIFTVIHDGVSADMGPYSERLKDTDIWNVINFIRTLGPKSLKP
jgi:mono/diheme cytochrome c family protein